MESATYIDTDNEQEDCKMKANRLPAALPAVIMILSVNDSQNNRCKCIKIIL